jgi:hypothetical protein
MVNCVLLFQQDKTPSVIESPIEGTFPDTTLKKKIA